MPKITFLIVLRSSKCFESLVKKHLAKNVNAYHAKYYVTMMRRKSALLWFLCCATVSGIVTRQSGICIVSH